MGFKTTQYNKYNETAIDCLYKMKYKYATITQEYFDKVYTALTELSP
jgi:hypothetical protein